MTSSLTQHWSQTTISAYQLYNSWLNSDEIGNSAGNFERLKNKTINADLAKLAAQTTTKGELKYLTPIEQYVATNLPVIPTVYGAAFDEYNSSNYTGWPSAKNQYEIGQPGSPQNEIVVLQPEAEVVTDLGVTTVPLPSGSGTVAATHSQPAQRGRK